LDSGQHHAAPGLEDAGPGWRFQRKWLPALVALFVLALVPRYYSGLIFGADLDGPGKLRIINYDEAGSCRAILGEFNYSSFLGHQILAIANAKGYPAPRVALTNSQARQYCYSRPLTRIHRTYSAVASAATVVLVALMALIMWPARPQIAWTAAALLGLSNFHVAQAQVGTADAPQVFFITLFSAALVYGLAAGKNGVLWASPLLLLCAVWAKWFVFAAFGYASLFHRVDWKSPRVCIAIGGSLLGALAVAALGWSELDDLRFRGPEFLWGSPLGDFGTGYGHIGTWRRWIRNAVNLPVVHLVGLGIPACLFVIGGLRTAWRDRDRRALWLVHTSSAVYVFYLLLLAPVTYYRHYLPLFPLAALLAALGFWESRWSAKRWIVALFLLYPAALLADSMYNYRNDPRHALRPWFESREQPRLLFTHYTLPPAQAKSAHLLDLDRYLAAGARYVRQADYVILSENWYHTAYASELNGPIAWKPEWLIKTKPEYVRAYRRILAGDDPNLVSEAAFNLRHFTPEFLLHRAFYGSFQLFIGDIRIFRVVGAQERTSAASAEASASP
jgi:hypothetical protein